MPNFSPDPVLSDVWFATHQSSIPVSLFIERLRGQNFNVSISSEIWNEYRLCTFFMPPTTFKKKIKMIIHLVVMQ